MELPAGKRIYRNPLADIGDQVIFFGLFLFGALGILFLKTLGFNQIIVTVFPLGLMSVYSAIALITKRYRLREDRVGDNVYYLGFLFTLVSLAYALHATQGDGSAVGDILRNFGIAISTTIVGLAGRVFFNQMREDPIEYEKEARYSLAEATTILRSQLADISTEVSSFKRKLVQIMEEGVVDISNTATESMAKNVEHFSLSTREATETIKNAFQVFMDHASRLNEAGDKTVNAINSLINRIDQIEAPPELLAARLEPIIAKFDEIANEAMKRNRAQTNDLKRLRDMIDGNSQSSANLQKSFDNLNTIATQKTEAFATWVDSTIGKLPALNETLRSTMAMLGEQMTTIQSLSVELAQNRALHERSSSEIRSIIESDFQTVHHHRQEIEKILAESRASLQSLQSTLVSLSKALVEQLGGH